MITWTADSIVIARPVEFLDRFLHNFVSILQRHTTYAVVGGFVAIALGRTRGTEDIDMYIPRLSKEQFVKLYQELCAAGFWCLNAEDAEDLFTYLVDNIPLRFADQGKAIPNIEIKFVKDQLDEFSLHDTVKVKIGDYGFIFSSLEMNIAFKRYYLKSPKDMEDASYLEAVLKDKINRNKLNKYRQLITRYR